MLFPSLFTKAQTPSTRFWTGRQQYTSLAILRPSASRFKGFAAGLSPEVLAGPEITVRSQESSPQAAAKPRLGRLQTPVAAKHPPSPKKRAKRQTIPEIRACLANTNTLLYLKPWLYRAAATYSSWYLNIRPFPNLLNVSRFTMHDIHWEAEQGQTTSRAMRWPKLQ